MCPTFSKITPYLFGYASIFQILTHIRADAGQFFKNLAIFLPFPTKNQRFRPKTVKTPLPTQFFPPNRYGDEPISAPHRSHPSDWVILPVN